MTLMMKTWKSFWNSMAMTGLPSLWRIPRKALERAKVLEKAHLPRALERAKARELATQRQILKMKHAWTKF